MAATKDQGNMLWVSPAKLIMKAQVRTDMKEKDAKEFGESIAQFGVMQPIVVRPGSDGSYIVIAGHRRTTAAQALGLTAVPILCRDVDEDEAAAMQLVENIQRVDLSLSDVSDGVWQLYNGAGGGSATLVASMLNKGKSWVSKALMLSAPGKAHTVARSLMATDKLGDIELAYMICQVEELDKGVAQAIGKNIENETRRTVKAWLEQVRGHAKAKGDENVLLQGEQPDDGEGDELPGVDSDSAHAVMIDSQDLDLLNAILKAAVVDHVRLGGLTRLRLAVSAAKAL